MISFFYYYYHLRGKTMLHCVIVSLLFHSLHRWVFVERKQLLAFSPHSNSSETLLFFSLLSVEAGKPGWLMQWWYCQVKQQGLFVNKCWGDPHPPFTRDLLKMKTAYSLAEVNVCGYLKGWKKRKVHRENWSGIKMIKMVVFHLNCVQKRVRYLPSLDPHPLP